jgi:imidazolonepropionase-like amidohydrolase
MHETWAVHGVYPSMAWAPDSREIVLWARGKLWRVDAESGARREIPFHVASVLSTREVAKVQTPVAPDEFQVKVLQGVHVSPQGDSVAYEALGKVWLRPLPDGAPRRLTQDGEHFELDPAYSRDGKHIAYVSWSDAELGAVRTIDLSSGEVRVLTPEPGHYREPAFTPDGEQVVYRKGSGGYITSPLWARAPGIYRIPVEGGEPRLVTKEGARPQFGRSSERVYLTRIQPDKDNDHCKLVSVELDGSDERKHASSSWASEIALAPDERWLAFVERYNAYVVPFAPTGREVALAPDQKSLPVARVSRDAGENLQFSGDSARLHWSLGPELYTRPLAEAFAFLEGAPATLPEPPASGADISFRRPHARPDGSLALVGGRIVTLRGDEVIEDGALVVTGNRIAAVGPRAQVGIPADALVVDVSGATLIPGLIDVHAHGGQAVDGVMPQSNWIHAANLAFGITTIHDPSNDTNAIHAVAELAKAGVVLSPRTFSTGTILYGAMGSYKAQVDSLDDALSHLRRLKAVGALSVKSYNQPRRDQRQQLVEAGRQLGINVVPEGGSTFQHNLTMVVDGHTGIEHQLPVEHVYEDVLQLWGKSGVGYTPTLVVGYGGPWGEEYWYQHEQVWADQRLLRFVPRFVVDPRARRRLMYPDEEFNHLRSAGICKALYDAGATVQVGAHGQLAGLAAHWELAMLVQGGLTPHEALRCGSLHGARYLGLDADLGSIEPGKLADVAVVEGNPLEDIARARMVRFTLLNGRLYDGATLAPADGRGGSAPTFFWTDLQEGLPAQTTDAGCAGCQ